MKRMLLGVLVCGLLQSTFATVHTLRKTVDGVEYLVWYVCSYPHSHSSDGPNHIIDSVTVSVYDINGIKDLTVPASITIPVDTGSSETQECPVSGFWMDMSAYSGLETLRFKGYFEADDFKGNSSLRKIIFENGCNVLNGAFENCAVLSELSFCGPCQVGIKAFYGCKELKKILGLENCTCIGPEAFAKTGMESVVIPAGVDFDFGVFSQCENLRKLVVQAGVGAVPDGVVFQCPRLTDVCLPSDLVKIGDSAFYECTSLSEIKLPNTLETIGSSAFYGDSLIQEILIPDAVSEIGASAFSLSGVESLDLTNTGVREIKEWTFYGSELFEIMLPQSVEVIGDYAFGCTPITNADFSAFQIVSIGEQAFELCGDMDAEVVLPKSLKVLGDWAFHETGRKGRDRNERSSVKFLGPPPEMGEWVFNEWDMYHPHQSDYEYATYEEEHAAAWRRSIYEWDLANGTTNQWHGLKFNVVIEAEPIDWKIMDDKGGQLLNMSWHLPTNDSYTIEMATADLKRINPKYAIWRSSMNPDDRYDDWSCATNIAKHYQGNMDGGSFSNYIDRTFGSIKGTAPVKYWIEIENPDDENNIRCITDISEFDYRQFLYNRIPPAEEPSASFVTRRRFGLAIGLSAYSDTAYMKYRDYSCYQGKPKELGGFVNDTKKFVQLLKDSGGVVDMSDGGAGDVILLTDEQATTEGIATAISGFPIKNGKPRFVPGDIAFLWIATHGVAFQDDGEGGISAYDGEYHNSFGSCYAKEYNGMKIRNTFLDDLSWVDNNPGVRVIGILPFCYAEKMTRGFDSKANVAWIAATQKDEQSTLDNVTTQFGVSFLQNGWANGVAYREQLQYASSFVRDYFDLPTIGNNDEKLTFLELARYTQSLAIGRSSRNENEKEKKQDVKWESIGNPSHLKVVKPEILDSVTVCQPEGIKTGGQVPALGLEVEPDSSGMLRVYYDVYGSDSKKPDSIILWYRPVREHEGPSEWRWVRVSAIQKGNDVRTWWYNNAMFFGSRTENQLNEIGRLLPNTLYEFRLQGINQYGYGKLSSRTVTARTGNLAGSAKENYASALSGSGEIQYLGSVDVGGKCFLLHLTAGCEGDGYRITAHVGGDLVCSAFVADIGEDGALSVNESENVTSHVLRSLKMSLDGAEGSFDGKDFKADIVVDKRNWSDEITIPANEEYENGSIATSIAGEVSYSAKSLPKGLSIDSSTGVISGTPTVPGSYVVLVTVKSKTDPTQTETIEVPIVIGNYVDETIAVNDEYGPFVPGEKVELKFPDGAAWKVTGLPAGLKWDAKLPGVTGVPTKPGSNTVYFTWTDRTVTPNITHKASSTFIVGSLPKVSVQIEGKGKVTGAGAYLANKKVTLKATASKGHVFAGWYLGEKLVSRSASFSFKVRGENMNYNARFVTAAADKASVAAAVNGLAFAAGGANKVTSLATNVLCGVALSWPLSHGALSATSVKVTGLPKGLKYDSKKKAVTGVPTAPGKTSSVKIAVTTAGKATMTFVLKVKVAALPEWAKGQFTGHVDENVLTMTVGSTGKISGKFKQGATNWTFSVSSFSAASQTAIDPVRLVCSATAKGTYKAKSGKETVKKSVTAPIGFTLAADPGTSPIAADGLGDFAGGADNVEVRRVAGVKISVNTSKGGTVKMDKSYGQVTSGKSVKLTAKVSKGYAFLGWFDAQTGARISQATSYSLKMSGADRLVVAKFKKEPVLAAPVLDWNAATEFPVGVSYSAKPKVSCEAAVKIVKVTGLPAGLSYKSGKVSGAPTAAKTYTVSVTVALATNSKKTWTLEQKLVVTALPAWAKGTFNGGSEKTPMQATLTVGSTGKVSGKLCFANAVWTLSGTHYTKLDGHSATLSLTAKKGSTKKTVTVTVGEDELGGFACSETKGFAFEARQNLWTSDELWKTRAEAIVGVPYVDPKGDLTVTFGANGKATAKLKVGKNTFSASAVLCPTAIVETAVTGRLYLSFAPNTTKKFKGAVRVVEFQL